MLSEISQSNKAKYHMISLIWRSKRQSKWRNTTGRDTENKPMVAGEVGGGATGWKGQRLRGTNR